MYQPKPYVVEFFPRDPGEPSNPVSEHATRQEAADRAARLNTDPALAYSRRHYPGRFVAIPNPDRR